MDLLSNLERILEILESGTNEQKINVLENLNDINNPEIIQKIISKLGDESIRVRGEAFSSLLLNEREITDILIKNLSSTTKEIRGFVLLVLANRNEVSAISEITKLVKDEHSSVRSCAIGALRYLKVEKAKEIFFEALVDHNMEVRRGALQALIELDFKIPKEIRDKISIEDNS